MFNLGKMIGNLKYMDKFELLPYHNMGTVKYKNLG
jgi:pyruvate formate lyase activating enzyme